MIRWFIPIAEWFGANDSALIPLMLFLILIVLIISLFRG